MQHTILKCPSCGHVINQGSRVGLYGSPIRKCPKCQNQYFDLDYIEPALEEDTKAKRIIDFMQAWLGSCLFALPLAGLVSLGFKDGGDQFMLMAFLIIISITFILLFYFSFMRENKNFENQKRESFLRLQSDEYLKLLLSKGYKIGKNSYYSKQRTNIDKF